MARDRASATASARSRSSSSTTTSSATRSSPRSCCARSRAWGASTATRSTSTPRCRSTSRRTTSCSRCCAPRTSRRSSSASRARARRRSRRPKKTQNMRGDLVENVRRIQSYGIQVQAGMIVGFDHDDATHLRGAAALHPGRPHPRLDDRACCRRCRRRRSTSASSAKDACSTESTGDQFVLSNILPQPDEPARALRGLSLAGRAALRLPQLPRAHARVPAEPRQRRSTRGLQPALGRSGAARAACCATRCCAAGPRRAWFTLSLLGATLLRRPVRVQGRRLLRDRPQGVLRVHAPAADGPRRARCASSSAAAEPDSIP